MDDPAVADLQEIDRVNGEGFSSSSDALIRAEMSAVHCGVNNNPFRVLGNGQDVPLDIWEGVEYRASVCGELIGYTEALLECREVLDGPRLPQGDHSVDVMCVSGGEETLCDMTYFRRRAHQLRLLRRPWESPLGRPRVARCDFGRQNP